MSSFFRIGDLGPVNSLVTQALDEKIKTLTGRQEQFAGKRLGLVFMNPSLRTRMSTEIAGKNLGLDVYALEPGAGSWGLEFKPGAVMNGDKTEHIKEAAMTIGSYVDLIGVRCFPGLRDQDQDELDIVINAFRDYSGVPVMNLESSVSHPLQTLADLMTIKEHQQDEKPVVVLSWAPHVKPLPASVANSFAEGVLASGYSLRIVQPPGCELSETFTKGADIFYDQSQAFQGADFVYAKSWCAQKPYGLLKSPGTSWMIDAKKMKETRSAKFMHCLPVRRNVVVSDEVLDAKNSLINSQVNNRVFAAQTVIRSLLEGVR